MEVMLIILFAAGATLFVMYPLYSRKRYLYNLEDMFELGDAKTLNFLESKKASVYDNIKELDFEYEMGKLSEEDYSSLRQGYMAEAQEVVKALENLKVKEEIEELIEGEVRSRRKIK
jgi:hypothetical protein